MEHGLILYRNAEEAHLTSTSQHFKLHGELNDICCFSYQQYCLNLGFQIYGEFFFCFEVFAQDKNLHSKKKKKNTKCSTGENTGSHFQARVVPLLCFILEKAMSRTQVSCTLSPFLPIIQGSPIKITSNQISTINLQSPNNKNILTPAHSNFAIRPSVTYVSSRQ